MVISAMDDTIRRLSIVRGNCDMKIFLIGACNPLMIIAVRQSSGMVESVASFWILEMILHFVVLYPPILSLMGSVTESDQGKQFSGCPR